jgi:hypothetical protein
MTALAADRGTRTRAHAAQRTRSGDVAATKLIYRGAIIARNAAGYVVPASDAAALKVIGIADQHVDNTAGADGALTVTYTTGVDAELVNDGNIVQARKEGRCYVVDDQTVTDFAHSSYKIPVGIVAEFTAALVWVHIDETMSSANQNEDALVNGAVSPAIVMSGRVEVIPLDIPDAATQTLAYLNPDKIEVIEVEVIKDVAGAGNTIQLKTTADVAISDAIAAAVDKAKTYAGTLDKATRTINAGAGFHVTATRAAGSMACQVFLHVIKR